MINEIVKIDLTDAERQAFKKLGTSAEFKIVAEAMEKYILRLNANLLTGTETEKGVSGEEFYKLRHFIYFWNKFLALTETEKDENSKL